MVWTPSLCFRRIVDPAAIFILQVVFTEVEVVVVVVAAAAAAGCGGKLGGGRVGVQLLRQCFASLLA